MSERGRRSHCPKHAAHAGRELLMGDVQLHVGWELPLMASPTQIIGAQDLRRANHGQQRLAAQPLVLRMVAAGTWQATLLGAGRLKLQQLAHRGCASLMEGGSQGCFQGLQIRAAVLATLRKHAAQELIHFPRNFLMDCSSRFFSWSVQPPRCRSTGRSAQIF